MKKEEFINACQQAGISIDQKQVKQFETYLHLLQEWNEKMNLTSIIEEEEIWEKHFYDSIIPFKNMEKGSLCDVGTGAGFPGIPVAIVYPNIQVTLLEPLSKRCRFLQTVKEALDLKVEICNERAEDFVKTRRESFDFVTSRAVARLTILLELCAPLVKVEGSIIALKGKNGYEELKNAQKALETLGVCYEKEQTIQVEDAMHLVFYLKKIKACPKKYPRNFGQIKKKPIGE